MLQALLHAESLPDQALQAVRAGAKGDAAPATLQASFISLRSP